MCNALPRNEHSPWKLRSCDIGEKAKQNSARNNAKSSKCFQFLCNNSDRTWFFNVLTFARSLGRCWKPWPPASVFNTSHGTWRMLIQEKPCLIPVLYGRRLTIYVCDPAHRGPFFFFFFCGVGVQIAIKSFALFQTVFLDYMCFTVMFHRWGRRSLCGPEIYL